MKVYAECNIEINPTVDAKNTRKRAAEVSMDIFTSQGVNKKADPITLVIKGANFSRVWELMSVYHKTDEELAEKARSSSLSCLLDGMSTEEVAAWARTNILEELKDMEGNENPLV